MQRVIAEQQTTCEEAALYIGLVVDGEISVDELARVEAHLASCDACQRERTRTERTKAALRAIADEGAAPPALVLRVSADLAREQKRERKSQRTLALGVALTLVGFTALSAALVVGRHEPAADPLVDESLARHSLDVPVDVASPDPTRLERYLATRIARPIRVPALTEQGLELHGARVVSVERRHAAQIVYRDALGQKVSLTAIPDDDGRLSERLARARLTPHASSELHFTLRRDPGVVWTAVSSLPADDLARALTAFAR